MKLSEYLELEKCKKSDLAGWLGVSKALVGRWDDIPEKYQAMLDEKLPDDVASRDWCIRENRLHWRFMNPNGSYRIEKFGHGSEFDYDYSPAKIGFIKGLLKQHGSVQAVFEWCGGGFERQFIQAVKDNCVCPNVVDMRKARIEGGKPVPVRVFPFGKRNA